MRHGLRCEGVNARFGRLHIRACDSLDVPASPASGELRISGAARNAHGSRLHSGS